MGEDVEPNHRYADVPCFFLCLFTFTLKPRLVALGFFTVRKGTGFDPSSRDWNRYMMKGEIEYATNE
ncbi:MULTISPECIES: hypothetical protein [Virgibacillus]|uniref:hypothetical protein n=1 Tax=Virgibacillus TaxID=84406 RepID=UPI0018DC86EB|nr:MULTISPECIES: hypothetical protein [Virgibacillus]MED3735426.1 hypothetical protein [Virgibacillus pantothenticus]